jgi:pyridoxamine 5'-phosphate oxidase family protein
MRQGFEPCALSEDESLFLCRGGLARVATVSPDKTPHVVPVVFEFDGIYLYFGGRNLLGSLKARNIMRNPRVAVVVDDVVSTSPWRARGVEIRGIAELLSAQGVPYVRITPLVKSSWGL